MVESCSVKNCGIKRPRCPVCNAAFVTNKYDLCTSCLLDSEVGCDNCGKESAKLFKTDMDELWCFECLPDYHKKGPALKVNRDILSKYKAPKNILSKQKLPSIKSICKGCNSSYNGPIDSKFCLSCLSLLYTEVCTACLQPVDSDVGVDRHGQCINCSAYTDNIDYAYGVGGGSKEHIIFTDYTGKCINCGHNRKVDGKPICKTCMIIAEKARDS